MSTFIILHQPFCLISRIKVMLNKEAFLLSGGGMAKNKKGRQNNRRKLLNMTMLRLSFEKDLAAFLYPIALSKTLISKT